MTHRRFLEVEYERPNWQSIDAPILLESGYSLSEFQKKKFNRLFRHQVDSLPDSLTYEMEDWNEVASLLDKDGVYTTEEKKWDSRGNLLQIESKYLMPINSDMSEIEEKIRVRCKKIDKDFYWDKKIERMKPLVAEVAKIAALWVFFAATFSFILPSTVPNSMPGPFSVASIATIMYLPFYGLIKSIQPCK